jgi:lipopolysaccharide export system permease protein
VGSKLVHLGDPDDSGGFRDSSILQLSRDFKLVERLDVERFVPGDLGLDLQGVERRRFVGDGQTLEWLPHLHLDLPEGERTLRLAPGRPEGMSRAELARQISLRSALGIASAEHRYEYYSRLAYALAGVAGALLAIALALRRGRTGHVNTTLVEGLVIAAGLWALLGVARALSIAGRLPPIVCAFGPEVLTLAVGLVALHHVNRSALL